jgi:hypothetical protein
MVAALRKSLRERRDKVFFRRYTDPTKIAGQCSFIPEMQMILHPRIK